MALRHGFAERLLSPRAAFAEMPARKIVLLQIAAELLHLVAVPDLFEGLLREIAEDERGVGVATTRNDAAVPKDHDGAPRIRAEVAHGTWARLARVGIGTVEVLHVRAHEGQTRA